MTKDNFNNVFIDLEKQIEEQMKLVIGSFQNMPENELLLQPNTNAWSISQCIQHLNSYGEYYLPLLEVEKNKRGKSAPTANYSTSWIGDYFVKMIDYKQSSKKLKSINRHLPNSRTSPHTIISTHLTQQETLLTYVREFHNMDLSKRTIPTSLSSLIKLNIIDTLRFLITHTSRHINQASKICSAN